MWLFSDEDRRKVFFYGDADIKYYDAVGELAQPCIDLIHDTMIDLVEYSIRDEWLENFKDGIQVLVIGSGTGAEVFRLLERFENIHVAAVDFSPEMNRELKRKFAEKYPETTLASKVDIIEEDFFSDTCLPTNLCQRLLSKTNANGFHAVVAGFLLHHYPIDLKRQFYQRIFDSLKPGGVVVHGDLFTFQSRSLTSFAHHFGEKWIDKQLSSPDEHLRAKYETLGSDAPRLHKEWLHHWNSTHIYHPGDKGHSSSEDKSIPSHEEFALDAGFYDVSFPFRLWEAGILWGRK